MTRSKKILFIINDDRFFNSHRLPIAKAAINKGYEVHLAARMSLEENYWQSLNVHIHPLKLHPNKGGIIGLYKEGLDIYRCIQNTRPDIIHLVTIKPVLLGGIAARIAGVPKVVSAISGLGYIFTATGLIAQIKRIIVRLMYKIACHQKDIQMIFQNPDDMQIIQNEIHLPKSKTILIPGSGIDLKEYAYHPLPENDSIVLFAARLLKTKGLYEFIDAVKIIKATNPNVRFVVAGELDKDNQSAIQASDLDDWIKNDLIEYVGFKENIKELLVKSSLVVLPSYREGLPKILIEAQAIGRPVITTNAPGCKDAILDQETGLLVPIKDHNALAAAMKTLINDKERSQKFGINARKWAEKQFDIKAVIDRHLIIYG